MNMQIFTHKYKEVNQVAVAGGVSVRWFVENGRWIERGKRVVAFEHELSKVKLSACGE